LGYVFSIDTVSPIKIIKKPIQYTSERKKLSLEYMEKHHGISQKNPTIKPVIIVLHYTEGGTINSIYNYFNRLYIEKERSFNYLQSPLNVSSHYLVDRDGTIYQLLEDTLFARHTIGLNYCAIGIENIGSKSNPLTNEQIDANAKLVRLLKRKHPIEYLIGHSEYGSFRKSNLWKETNSQYYTGKEDPGILFMQKVRAKVNDLKLKNAP